VRRSSGEVCRTFAPCCEQDLGCSRGQAAYCWLRQMLPAVGAPPRCCHGAAAALTEAAWWVQVEASQLREQLSALHQSAARSPDQDSMQVRGSSCMCVELTALLPALQTAPDAVSTRVWMPAQATHWLACRQHSSLSPDARSMVIAGCRTAGLQHTPDWR
jgi:hypothetical protein